MHDLEIIWRDGRSRFGTDSGPVVVGRSSSSSVVITDGIVSRQHLSVTYSDSEWHVEDVSTHGTFDTVGTRLPRKWTVQSQGNLRLGSPAGFQVTIRPLADSPGNRGNDPDIYSDPDSPPTIVDFGPPPRPTDDSADLLAVPSSGSTSNQLSDRSAGSPAFSSQAPDRVLADANFSDASAGSASTNLGSPNVIDGETSRSGSLLEAQTDLDSDSFNYEAAIPMAAGAAGVLDVSKPDTLIDLTDGDGSGTQVPSQPVPAATFVEEATLRLSVDGEDYTFLPGSNVSLGRDPQCTVTIDERHSLVSREHLRFSHQDGDWWIEDRSSKGTFIDGRRMRSPYKAEGAFLAQLGDVRAGTPLRVVTTGDHRQPRNLAGLAVAATAAAALLLVGLLAWFVLSSGSGEAQVLERAKKSSAMLLSDSGQGSGFFVEDSLIVTNQHVAAAGDQLIVAISPEIDQPAEISYIASLVESHPYLDLAVLKITNKAQVNESGSVDIGDATDSADISTLELGDSTEIAIGDPVVTTGFPGRFSVSTSDDMGNLRLSPVSATSGQAANWTIWPGCSNPDFTSFIPVDAPPGVTCSIEGDISEGVLLADFASGAGASGSPVISDGRVVAVVFAGEQDGTDSRSITTKAMGDWLSQVISDHG